MKPKPLLLLLIAFLAASRAIFWPAHPPTFDFANFALGVYRFAPIDHQPHPPGYPFVILLGRAFAALGFSAVRALELTALVGGIAALLGAYRLGQQLSGELGGLLAAFLLAVEPVCWYSGVSSPVRIYLAAGVCWLLFCLLELARGRVSLLWVTALLLAVFAGFRPELLLFFAVPFVLAARWAGVAWRKIALAAALVLAACLPWALWLVASFGSPYRLTYVYYYYFLHHASTTSAFFGAPAGAWRRMLRCSLEWNAIPAGVAILAAAVSRGRAAIDRRFLSLAALYFFPALFLQLALHQSPESPDQSLGTIALLCVLAGSLLGAAHVLWPALAAAFVMLSISYAQPSTLPPEIDILSLRRFALEQRSSARLIAGLHPALEPGDALVVLNDSPLAGRILEYEFPETKVAALDSTVQPDAASAPTGWLFFERHQTPITGQGIALPGALRLQVFGNPSARQQQFVRERLCPPSACVVDGPRTQVSLGSRPEPIPLPPYMLWF